MTWHRNAARTGRLILGVVLLAGMGRLSAADHADALAQADARLQAIYGRGEFRAGRYHADWLADGS